MTSSGKTPTLYTTKLSSEQMDRVEAMACSRSLERYSVPYARFAFRGDGFNVVGYESLKLVVQGKQAMSFVEFELEPYVLGQAVVGYDEVHHPEWFEEHAGMDESGKGDLFGPLVTACVVAGGDVVKQWMADGIRDSKAISSDHAIFVLEKKILSTAKATNVMCLRMEKYNELYDRFGKNLNILLGWMHSRSLENALAKYPVPWGMLDQFSKQPITQRFLHQPSFQLKMQTKAEADPVVAAASILARAEFSRQIEKLSEEAGFKIAKGAGKATTEQAQRILREQGHERLSHFIKMHFVNAPKP